MISHVVSFIPIPIFIYFTFLPFVALAQTQPICCMALIASHKPKLALFESPLADL